MPVLIRSSTVHHDQSKLDCECVSLYVGVLNVLIVHSSTLAGERLVRQLYDMTG
jgi:hypothetical protein